MPRGADRWTLAALAAASGPAFVAEPVVAALVAVAVVAWLSGGTVVVGQRGPPSGPAEPTRATPASPANRVLALVGILLIATVAATRARLELEQAERALVGARELLGATSLCEAQAVVVGSPVMRRPLEPSWGDGSASVPSGGGPGRFSATVQVLSGRCGGKAIRPPFRARLYEVAGALRRGDRIEFVAQLGPVELLRNPELPDPRARIALDPVVASGRATALRVRERGRGLTGWIDGARQGVRARIEHSYAPQLAPYARALVLGETDLAEDEQQAFRRSGLAHLLAVSGTHLVVTVLALCAVVRALLVRVSFLAARLDCGAVASAAGAVMAPLYADFAGGSGSAKRAAAMLAVTLLVRACGRRPATSRCFALSLGGAALVEPLVLADPSFLLSVGATAGLLLGQDALARTLVTRESAWRWLGAAVGCTLGATMGCTPVLLWWGVELPLLGVAANLLAAPLCEAVALPCCLAHAALGWLPAAEQGAAVVASGALTVVRAVAQAAAAPSFATVAMPRPTPEQLAALLVAALGAWHLRTPWRAAGCARPPAARAWVMGGLLVAATLWGLEREARHAGQPPGLLRVTVLDVGQGDALLVDLPDGTLLTVDAGGARSRDMALRVVEPALRARRRNAVERVVITHPHEDHAGGIPSLLRRFPVHELWLPAFGTMWPRDPQSPAPTADWPRWIARRLEQAGVTLRTASELCDRTWWAGGARIDVLSPCPGADPARGANHNSLVLRIRFGLRSVLLMADADAAAEQRLLRSVRALGPVDLLKVGHHGSRTSTSADLVSATSPRMAAISSGARNRLGHPAPEIVERLVARGGVLWRTDRDGALRWQTDGLQVEVARADHPLGRLLPLSAMAGAAR